MEHLFFLCVVCRFNLPFYLSTCQHDNQIRPPCTNVRQHSMHQLMYLMDLRKMAPNNDVHDDVLIDIVVYEQLLSDATSNQRMLKRLRRERERRKTNIVEKRTKRKKRDDENKSHKFLLRIIRKVVDSFFCALHSVGG